LTCQFRITRPQGPTQDYPIHGAGLSQEKSPGVRLAFLAARRPSLQGEACLAPGRTLGAGRVRRPEESATRNFARLRLASRQVLGDEPPEGRRVPPIFSKNSWSLPSQHLPGEPDGAPSGFSPLTRLRGVRGRVEEVVGRVGHERQVADVHRRAQPVDGPLLQRCSAAGRRWCATAGPHRRARSPTRPRQTSPRGRNSERRRQGRRGTARRRPDGARILRALPVARIGPMAVSAGLVFFSSGLGLKKWVMSALSPSSLNNVASGVKSTKATPDPRAGRRSSGYPRRARRGTPRSGDRP